MTGASQTVSRRTQRTENLDRYSIVKDRRNEPTPDLSWVGRPRGAKTGSLFERLPVRTLEDLLVELIGIEPTTSGLQNPRSPN